MFSYGWQKPPPGVSPDLTHPLSKGAIIWPFNEGSGRYTRDTSGKYSALVTSWSGQGPKFYDYAYFSPAIYASSGQDMTLVWAAITTRTDKYTRALGFPQVHPDYKGMMLGNENNSWRVGFNDGGVNKDSNKAPVVGQRVILIATILNGMLSFYLNGVQYGTTSDVSAYVTTIWQPLAAACGPARTDEYIAEIFYNRGLTYSEVQELSLEGPFCMFPMFSQVFYSVPAVNVKYVPVPLLVGMEVGAF